MNEAEQLIPEIKAKGYWDVIARPSKFIKERIDIEDCRIVVEKNQVSLRGTNYPHTREHGNPTLFNLENSIFLYCNLL